MQPIEIFNLNYYKIWLAAFDFRAFIFRPSVF